MLTSEFRGEKGMAEVHQLEEERRRHGVGDLVRELSEETVTLIRQEVELARAEVAEKVGRLGAGAALLAVAGVIGFVGFAVLTAAAVAGLALVFELWLAALILGAVYMAFALLAGALGFALVKRNSRPLPSETVQTVREDVQWIRQKSRSGTK